MKKTIVNVLFILLFHSFFSLSGTVPSKVTRIISNDADAPVTIMVWQDGLTNQSNTYRLAAGTAQEIKTDYDFKIQVQGHGEPFMYRGSSEPGTLAIGPRWITIMPNYEIEYSFLDPEEDLSEGQLTSDEED